MEQKLTIKLNNGMEMPRLGMGTWFLGENKKLRLPIPKMGFVP